MKKQKWTEKPITWGGYLKLCGVVYVISVIAGFVWYIASFEPAWWSSFKGRRYSAGRPSVFRRPGCILHSGIP